MNIQRLSIALCAALMLSRVGLASTNVITVGQTAFGTFTDSSPVAYFTFDGLSNDIIRVCLTEERNSPTFLHIFDPNGALLASSLPARFSILHENVIRNLRLPRDGNYLIACSLLFAQSSDDYAVSVVNVPGITTTEPSEDGPLMPGNVRFGELALGDVDAFQYFAESNEVINVQATLLGGNTATAIEIYGPSGTLLTNGLGGVIVRLPDAGLHWIVCYGGFGTNQYALNTLRIPGGNAEEPGEGGALTPGIQRRGSLETGDMDVYEYFGTVGETITLLLTRTNSIGGTYGRTLWLHSPDGEVLATGSGGDQVDLVARKLPVTGSFFVVVAGFATGGYGLTVVRNPGANQNEPGEGGVLEGGQERSGFLSTGDIDIYEIQGHCGETITLQMGARTTPQANFLPRLELHSPNGEIVVAIPRWDFLANAAAVITERLSETGTYLVLCLGANAVTTNNYRLTFVRNPGPNPYGAYVGPLVPGQPRSAVLGFADVDVHTFWGRFNDQISLNMSETTPDDFIYPCFQLHAPSGAIIADVEGNSEAGITNLTLPLSGEYIVVCTSKLFPFVKDLRYSLNLQVVPTGYDGPSLWTTRCDSDILVCWPTNFAAYRLESTETLSATNWLRIDPPYNLLGNQNAVGVSSQFQSQFFRLSRE